MKKLFALSAVVILAFLAASCVSGASPTAWSEPGLIRIAADPAALSDTAADLRSGAILYGDANGDGRINSKDVVAVMKSIVSGSTAKLDAKKADVNLDESVNSKDVIAIMKYLAGISTVRLGHRDTLRVITPSTCTKRGRGTLTCSACGDTVTVSLPLAKHNFRSERTTAPSCLGYGVNTYTCSVCGASYIEKIPPSGHFYVDGRCAYCFASLGSDLPAYYGPSFSLSKTGKNVAILFIDRALGEDFPYLLKERPDLKTVYDGFTYYSNVISFGGHTNAGAPPIMGGYEYTPVEMNRRRGELLVDKHNESMKVLPVMFLDKGFNVTVCDAPYGNYSWYSDLSVYDDYPKIKTYHTTGYFTLPDAASYGSVGSDFLAAYGALVNLRTMTKICDDGSDNFLFFYNDTPHQVVTFREGDYVPDASADNSAYSAAHRGRFTVDGRTLRMGPVSLKHYQTNMATMLEIGKWLDYLRLNGVYDNTKIIIVADHGYYLHQLAELDYKDHKLPYGENVYIGNYFPLLLVKDFDAHGFSVSSEFMTNADVPTLACEGVIRNPVNPFTGKKIDMKEKTAHPQFIITDHAGWSTKTNNGRAFTACTWAAVTSDIWNRSDWQFIDDYVVLYDHKMPK